MTFINLNIIFLCVLINFHNIIITCFNYNYINNNNSEIIFFNLDNTDDLIIKDIYLTQYNDNFNILIDTMGFISGLFLSKQLRYDYMNGDILSPMNSYRTFEGHKAELNLYNKYNKYNNKSNNYFPMGIFKVYNKINFYNKNKKYNGIIGLALNYTEDVLLDERFFFGESKQYSILHYIKNNLRLISENIFSIYKDKLILGDINIINTYNNNIMYCKCVDNIYDFYIYFFWNCNIDTIVIDNKIYNYSNAYNNYNYSDIKISLIFDSLLKDSLISTNMNIAKIILNQINNNNCYCYINNYLIYCNIECYDIISDMNLKIIVNKEIFIELPLSLIIKNKKNEYFYLSIEINEFNIDKNINIIKIGKDLFNYYYVVFDKTNKKIGVQKYENIELFIDEKYYYLNIISKSNLNDKNNNLYLIRLLFSVVIILSFFGSILLIYMKRIE